MKGISPNLETSFSVSLCKLNSYDSSLGCEGNNMYLPHFRFRLLLPMIALVGMIDTSFAESKINADIYLKAYPDYVDKITGDSIIWKDGSTLPLTDSPTAEKTVLEKLENPSLLDQISIPYPPGKEYKTRIAEANYDPGRLRNLNFFKKMYGHTKAEVANNLVTVAWLPKSFPDKYSINVTKINDVSEKIKQISAELDQLPDEYKKYLENPGGTFNWRNIAGTDRLSAHSFGMTIDINVNYSNYWLWDYKKSAGVPSSSNIPEAEIAPHQLPSYRNHIPFEIVEIFEKHGFIWGGKWNHYDTMHFEYRPELLVENESK